MIARSPKATWKYVLEEDRPLLTEEQKKRLSPEQQQALLNEQKAKATVWIFGHLSLAEEASIIDNILPDPFTGVRTRQSTGSQHLQMLRSKLMGWENFPRPDGTQIQWKAGPLGGAHDDLLFEIPINKREELARALENELEVNVDEMGKSSPPSTPATAAT